MLNYYLFAFFLLFSTQLKAENWPSYEISHKHFPKKTLITIKNDPVYHTEKQYNAFPLNPIIKKLAKQYKTSLDHCLIIFSAEDGYKVTLSYPDAIKENGYIAFQDLAAKKATWIKFKFGFEYISPAPYYLIWPKNGLDKWRYPSPFQLKTITLQSSESYYSAAAPKSKNIAVNQGFSIFSRYCIRCHSINHSGGTLGPELNLTKNRIDYLSEDQLNQFILDPSRYNSETKMPVFKHILSEKQTLLIQYYLKTMKTKLNK